MEPIFYLIGFSIGAFGTIGITWFITITLPEICRIYRNKHWYYDDINHEWIKQHNFWRCTCQITKGVKSQDETIKGV